VVSVFLFPDPVLLITFPLLRRITSPEAARNE